MKDKSHFTLIKNISCNQFTVYYIDSSKNLISRKFFFYKDHCTCRRNTQWKLRKSEQKFRKVKYHLPKYKSISRIFFQMTIHHCEIEKQIKYVKIVSGFTNFASILQKQKYSDVISRIFSTFFSLDSQEFVQF